MERRPDKGGNDGVYGRDKFGSPFTFEGDMGMDKSWAFGTLLSAFQRTCLASFGCIFHGQDAKAIAPDAEVTHGKDGGPRGGRRQQHACIDLMPMTGVQACW